MFKISLVFVGDDSKTREKIKRIALEENYTFEEINANITTKLAFSFSYNQIIILSLNRESIEENEKLLLLVLNKFNSHPTIVVLNDYYLYEKSLDLGCIGVVFRSKLHKEYAPLRECIVLAKELLYSRSLSDRNKDDFIMVKDPNGKKMERKYVCASDSTKLLIEDAKKFAKKKEHILITGPTGTGKEDLGKIIHNASQRKEQHYDNINLGATPKGLMASTLFGYIKGSFSDAKNDHQGIVEKCDGGTLVLDEFGDITPEVQIMLLRLLENGEYHMVGDNRHKKVDVRIIATTKYSVKELSKKIREDLLYRFMLHLRVLPLKSRPQDLAFLINEFMKQANKDNKSNCQLSVEAKEVLLKHEYPGNIRELKSIITKVVIKSEGNIIDDGAIQNNIFNFEKKNTQHSDSSIPF